MTMAAARKGGTPAIDVDSSVNSGQVFLWGREGDRWYGIDGQDVIGVGGGGEQARSYREGSGGRSGGSDFFRRRDDIAGITRSISRDPVIGGAVRRYPGLRLLDQDPFQCLISFIVSANSSIPRIRGCLRRMTRMFGDRVKFEGREFFLFPEPAALAGAPAGTIARCGVGYRAKYIHEAARMVHSGRIDLDGLRGATYGDAREALLPVPGVGGKVADCVMLFSLDKLEAFPLDRWVARVLDRHYPGRFLDPARPADAAITGRRYEALHERVVDHFGQYAGYAQQFLFKMERDDRRRVWLGTRGIAADDGDDGGGYR